jgi:glycogen operon protein
VSWVSWKDDPEWAHLHDLARLLLRLRSDHLVLRQRSFFQGRPVTDGGRKDITWLQPSGHEMTGEAWADSDAMTLGFFLAGDALRGRTTDGQVLTDTSYLMWLHAGPVAVDVTLPKDWADEYLEVVRTDQLSRPDPLSPGTTVQLAEHTFALYEARTSPGHAAKSSPEQDQPT